MRSGSVGMKLMCSPVGGIDGSCNADVKLLCPFHKLKQGQRVEGWGMRGGGVTMEWMKVARGRSGDGMCKMVRGRWGDLFLHYCLIPAASHTNTICHHAAACLH